MSLEDYSGIGGDGYIAGAKLERLFWLQVLEISEDPIQLRDISTRLAEEASSHPDLVSLPGVWDEIVAMLNAGSLPDDHQRAAFFQITDLVGLRLPDVIIRKRNIDV